MASVGLHPSIQPSQHHQLISSNGWATYIFSAGQVNYGKALLFVTCLHSGVHFSLDVLPSWADRGSSAYVKIFRTVTRNAVNKSVWRKKDCSWPPLNKYAMNIWLSSLKIRAHLSWRTGKHLHVLHVRRTCSTCSCPGQQDTTTYAALAKTMQLQIQRKRQKQTQTQQV